MKELVGVYYIVIAIVTIAFLATVIPQPTRPTAAECGIAEISPDMSPRDREVCRQLRQIRHRT